MHLLSKSYTSIYSNIALKVPENISRKYSIFSGKILLYNYYLRNIYAHIYIYILLYTHIYYYN